MSTPVEETGAGVAATDAEGTPLQYATVEDWVRDYLLPSFPRPAGELGAAGRWRWCEQWWKHDEAVTILTALWYGWEHAAVQALGMLDWLPRLYYFLPILCGDDGPFRLCAPANGDLAARHDMPAPAEVVPARRDGGAGGPASCNPQSDRLSTDRVRREAMIISGTKM